MKINGNIKFTYKNEECANLVFDSLEIDNENFLKSELTENSITYNITSSKLGTFLTTADDLIASEIVAEKIINNTQK